MIPTLNCLIAMLNREPAYEYRTTFAVVPEVFPNYEHISEDLSKISPKPPKGDDWQLASSTTVQTRDGQSTILYFWERNARPRFAD